MRGEVIRCMGSTGRAPRFGLHPESPSPTLVRVLNIIKSAYLWTFSYVLVGWLLFDKEPMQAVPLLVFPLIFGVLAWALCALLRKLRIE